MKRLLTGLILLVLTVLAGSLQFRLSSADVQRESRDSAASAYITETEDLLKIGNEFLEIAITDGGRLSGAIYSITEKSSGVDFIKCKDVMGCLFWLIYRFPDTWEVEGLVGSGASSSAYMKTLETTGAWLNITWSGLFSSRRERQLNITVTISINVPSGSKLSYWHIVIDNRENGVIEKIGFPLIFGVGQISDEKTGDYLVMPQGPGILCKNPQLNLKPGVGLGGVYYPSEHFNMQFMAYYAKQVNKGLYLADYDSSGTFVKYFSAVNRQGRYLEVFNEHVPEFHSNTKVVLPYPVVVGVFEGDWWDAAQLYKNWAAKQWWAAQGTIAERDDIPLWLKRTGIMADVYTRFWCRNSTTWSGPFSNLPKIAEAMKQYYDSAPLLWWRGWEKHGFGMAPPEYLPPTEGWNSFKNAINETHVKGGRICVLPLTSCYSFNATGWQDFIPHAPRDYEGKLYISCWEIINNTGLATRQAAFVVSPGEYWCNRVLQMVTELVSAGVDIVQLDANPLRPFIDWFGSEGHVGGGTWWAEGLTTMLTKIRREVKQLNLESALSGEFYSEPYIPFLDAVNEPSNIADNPLVFSSGESYNSTLNTYIPLWHTVYHEYQIMYSHIALIYKENVPSEKLYYLRSLAMVLVWGEIPVIAMDPPGTGRPDDLTLYDTKMMEYTRRIVQARTTYAYPYLVEGKMLRQLELRGIPLVKIPGVKQVPYSGAEIPAFIWPGVMTSAWEAPDGSIGIILTSICDSQVNVSIPLSQLSVGARRPAYLVRNGEYVQFNNESVLLEPLTITLDPLDVCLLVLKYPESLCTIMLNTQPRVASIIVDNTQYYSSQMPLCFPWAAGTVHSLKVQTIVQTDLGTRYVFKSWSDGSSSAERIFQASTPTTLTAQFRLEYKVEVSSEQGVATGGGWFAPGFVCNVSVSPTSVPKDFFTNHVFYGWVENDRIVSRTASYSFTVTRPVSLKASWRTEINLTAIATIALVILLTLIISITLLKRRKRSL